jgi:hypothetical protein
MNPLQNKGDVRTEHHFYAEIAADTMTWIY